MEYLTREEIKSLFEITRADDGLFHLFLLVTLGHSLRVSEALALTVTSIDGGHVHVYALKDGVSRLEPLHVSQDVLFDEGRLATHAHGLKQAGETRLFPWSRPTVDRKMKKYCGLAGIASKKAHMHSLRHSAAMMVFQKTTSLGCVKQALRHKSWSSSLVYLNESDATKAYTAMKESLASMAG